MLWLQVIKIMSSEKLKFGEVKKVCYVLNVYFIEPPLDFFSAFCLSYINIYGDNRYI